MKKHIEDAVDKRVTYYHVSHNPLPVGAVLESRGSRVYTPDLVDTLRPPGKVRRRDYFFMVTRPHCLRELGQDLSAQYHYRVTPVREVVKANYGQIERLDEIAKEHDEMEAPSYDRRAVRAAKAYWEGKPARGKPCRDEYLTTAFHVDEEVVL